jgi:hypothetical protein
MFKKIMLCSSILIMIIGAFLIKAAPSPAVHAAAQSNIKEISTLNGLRSLAASVSGGNSHADETYIMTQNIDGTGFLNWETIGTVGKPFEGNFDGNGFVIYGLNSNGLHNKLFGAATGEIKNVNLIGGSLSLGGEFGYAKTVTGLHQDITSALTTVTKDSDDAVISAINAKTSSNFANCLELNFTQVIPAVNGIHDITDNAFLGTDGVSSVSVELKRGDGKENIAVGDFLEAITVRALPVTGAIQIKIQDHIAQIPVGETELQFFADVWINNNGEAVLHESATFVTWSVAGNEGPTTISNIMSTKGLLDVDTHESASAITIIASIGEVQDRTTVTLERLDQAIVPMFPSNVAETTHNMITCPIIGEITIPAPFDDYLLIEYNISKTNTPDPTAWQTSNTFSGLDPETTYFIFARTQASTIHKTGTASAPITAKTKAAPKLGGYKKDPIILDYSQTVTLICAAIGGGLLIIAGGLTTYILIRIKKSKKTVDK